MSERYQGAPAEENQARTSIVVDGGELVVNNELRMDDIKDFYATILNWLRCGPSVIADIRSHTHTHTHTRLLLQPNL
jgi:hypothetical protein